MNEPLWETLAQVREIRRVAERRPFRGYSGRARATCAVVVMAGAWLLSGERFAGSDWMLLMGWLGVAGVALLINLIAVGHWFLFDPEVGRERRKMMPVLEILPPLVLGGALTLTMAQQGGYQLLYGMWMMLFGMVNFYAYPLLPRAIRTLGLFYFACGLVCLVHPGIAFAQTWPMGVVFGVGELAGGVILHRHRRPESAWFEVFIPRMRGSA